MGLEKSMAWEFSSSDSLLSASSRTRETLSSAPNHREGRTLGDVVTAKPT
jgi:hypothetical protein